MCHRGRFETEAVCQADRTILNTWISEFPDKYSDDIREASDIGIAYVELNDFDRASDWYERAHDLHEQDLFPENL